MTFFDAHAYVTAVLRESLPEAIVETQINGPRAISVPWYVWVDDSGGLSLYPGRLDDATFNVVTYSQGSRGDAAHRAYLAQNALFNSWETQLTRDGGSISFFRVEQRPTLQPVDGLPENCYRYFATYSVGARAPRE